MRGLNLSRLAAAAKAQEAAYFKDVSKTQAQTLRNKLPPGASSPAAAAEPTVDTLSSISAHSVYRTLLKTPPPSASPSSSSRVLSAVRRATLSDTPAPPRARTAAVDQQMMRVLGSGKLGILNEMPETRALPGGERYAEGAALGMASFAVATAIVTSVGVGGCVWLYWHPEVVKGWEERSKRAYKWIGQGVEGRLEGVRRRMEGSSAGSSTAVKRAEE